MTDLFAGKFFFSTQPDCCGQIIGEQGGVLLYQEDTKPYYQTIATANTSTFWKFYDNRVDRDGAFSAHRALKSMAVALQ